MSIIITNQQFHLQTKNTSYVIGIYRQKYPVHLYWGDRFTKAVDLEYFVDELVTDRAAGVHSILNEEKHSFLTDVSLEFSILGGGLYRSPTVHARYADGSTVSDFVYEGYRLYEGKEKLPGLPAVYAESGDKVQTLELCMKEERHGLYAWLTYSVFEDYDVITRCVRYENKGGEVVELLSAQSASVDLYAPKYKLMHLYGDWLREGCVEYSDLDHVHMCIDSRRGSSSAMAQPFAALLEPGAAEEEGKVYAFSLVYSGSFQIEAERDSVGQTRINAGISPFDFNWKLGPGEIFQTPEAVLVYSGAGIGRMSRIFHRIYRERLCRGTFRDRERPLVINHWDATGRDFTENQLIEIAQAGAETGLELFVMDDGWFGDAEPHIRPLGDWFVNKRKLPGGLKKLAERINESGMKFGIWFEPEVVSPASCLYREHPDWCMSAPGRESTQMYYQLLLDLAKKEVQDYIVEAISNILDCAEIAYVKWDYNRSIVETQNQMHRHKYMLGLYRVLELLTEKYPDVLFESCSSGGGRFDPGMLYYMPQTWTSDNQQAMSRLKIQHGMSMVYPAITMTAHVGQVEFGQDKFNPHLNTAAMVAMGGNFGFEMDLSRLSAAEKEQVKGYVECYRSIRRTVQFGEMYRLSSPFTEENAAWEFVDENQAVLFTYQKSAQNNGEEWRVRLKGLDEKAVYELDGAEYDGEVLMKLGYRVFLKTFPNESHCLIFRKVRS